MKTIRILLLALLASAAFVCPRAQAQIGQITNPVSAPLYAQDAGTCSATANSNLIQQLPPNASTTTVNLSGTFSATVTVRASNNGGATWVTLGTASAAGTTTYGTNSYTHLCADVTTYTSGTVNVTISTGVVGGGNGNSGSVSLPTTLSAPGVFTNTHQNENFTITLNGPCTYSDFTSTSILTDGFSTCIIIPSSGVTNAFTNGIAAYVKNTNSNTTGQNGYVGGVGVYAQALCTAGGSAHCWGMNPSVIDVSGFPGTLFGEEVDVTATNTTTTGFGVLAAMLGSAQPTLDHFPAFYINTKAGSNFTTGFETQNGSISSSNGFAYGSVGTQLASTNPSHSQLLLFNGRNASGTALQCGIELLASSTGDTTDGTMGFGQCPLQTTGLYAAGTQSVTGCSLTSALGGPWAGSFHSGTTGTCTVTITPKPATNGYACKAQDMTTPADVINQTATNSTTATLSGTTASGDVITWSCIAF